MGNEIGSYKNCTLIESNEISNVPFAVYSGFAPDDTDVSVFVYQKDEVGADLIQNAVKVSIEWNPFNTYSELGNPS